MSPHTKHNRFGGDGAVVAGVREGSDSVVTVDVVVGGANTNACDGGRLLSMLVLLLLHIIALGGAEMRQALSIPE